MSSFDFYSPAGAISIEYEWIPKPEVIARKLDRIAANLNQMQVPLTESRDVFIGGIEVAFATETAPGGGAWAPWDDEYKFYAEGRNIGLLRLTDDMYQALISTSAYMITAREAFFTGDGVPGYWVFHQSGTSKMPQRQVVGMSGETEAIIMAVWEEWFDEVAQWDSGGGGGIAEPEVIGHTRYGQPIIRTSRGPRFGRKP